MDQSNYQPESKWMKIILFVVAISLAGNVIQFIKRADVIPSKKELIAENKDLHKEVNLRINELNKYKGISKKIDNVILDGNAKIEEKEKYIARLIKENRFKDKESKKLHFQLDSIKEQYLNVIDSILVERENKKAINEKLENQEEIISQLNKKIGLASLLIGDGLNASPMKKTNKDKLQPTALAKKTSEIEICIDILENKISKPDARNFYFVITTPDAKVLIDGAGESLKFNHPDYKTVAECSKSETINYKNQKIHLCTTIKPTERLLTGLYVVEVFTEENKLGMTTFSLK